MRPQFVKVEETDEEEILSRYETLVPKLPKLSGLNKEHLFDVLLAAVFVMAGGGAGWFSHALFWQPDYSETIDDLKKDGYNNLALTIQEQKEICPNGSNRQRRSCKLLLTAGDILAKTQEPQEEAPKVAQANINVPQ